MSGTNLSTDIKSYSGAVAQTVAGTVDFFGQVICESTSTNGAVPGPTAPVVAANPGACSGGTVVN